VTPLKQWRSAPGLARLAKAFEFLETASLGEKPAGRYPIDGDRMYVLIQQTKPRDPKTRRFETHRKYLDIHYLVRGQELIGSTPVATLHVSDPYKADTDVELFDVPERYERLILTPGEFAVFFPGQGHLPGCRADSDEELRKAVVKVRVE
jgi:YhcH/YjgK/YiaL family protein